MLTGMLWFDNSKSPLLTKVAKAKEYYEKKYGLTPNLVLAHPSMFEEAKSFDAGGVWVRPYRVVLPGHIWIGIEDKA